MVPGLDRVEYFTATARCSLDGFHEPVSYAYVGCYWPSSKLQLDLSATWWWSTSCDCGGCYGRWVTTVPIGRVCWSWAEMFAC